jgi:hypothetical protein
MDGLSSRGLLLLVLVGSQFSLVAPSEQQTTHLKVAPRS